jgi:hypothetical protein
MKLFQLAIALCAMGLSVNNCAAQTPNTAAPMQGMQKKTATVQSTPNPLSAVYSAYFGLKDALVASDSKAAATAANTLSTAIGQVSMEGMNDASHKIWMQHDSLLLADADFIKASDKLAAQRSRFIPLSETMYAIMKAIAAGEAIYYEHCPMANNGKGANWLSKEKTIKNPYFGKAMLTCGQVTETLR